MEINNDFIKTLNSNNANLRSISDYKTFFGEAILKAITFDDIGFLKGEIAALRKIINRGDFVHLMDVKISILKSVIEIMEK